MLDNLFGWHHLGINGCKDVSTYMIFVFFYDVIICRYTFLGMRNFTASTTALTHLVELRQFRGKGIRCLPCARANPATAC